MKRLHTTTDVGRVQPANTCPAGCTRPTLNLEAMQ
jgi:hypothetical protein